MPQVSNQDLMMRQFLLDKLDQETREQIEERFLTENAFREELLLAEESLIEDYLDNQLDDDDREKFHSLFASSREQRRKLTIARAIKSYAKTENERNPLLVEDLSRELPDLPATTTRRSYLF